MRHTLTCLLGAAVLAISGGCAVQPLYRWGQYDELLYRSYKDAAQVETLRTRLEAHLTALQRSRATVPPGLYADLGTLYLQKGDATTARAYYVKERDAWPESRVLMESMISNLDRRAGAKGESKS